MFNAPHKILNVIATITYVISLISAIVTLIALIGLFADGIENLPPYIGALAVTLTTFFNSLILFVISDIYVATVCNEKAVNIKTEDQA